MYRPPPDRRRQRGGQSNSHQPLAPLPSPNPGFPYFQPFFPQQCWNFPPPATSLQDLCARVETALEKAHCELLTAGQNVSAWKVSQLALVSLQVDSWPSLGFQFQDIPYLRRLVATEGKVNAFIHCFVGVWRIASVHDLDVAICNNEGITCFDALRLGPLLQHPLVSHYFSVPPDATEVPKITSEEIISHLSLYVDKVKRVVVPEEFLSFLMDKYGVSCKEKLGVRIQSLGLHLAYIRDAKRAENFTLSRRLDSKNNKGEIEGRQPSQPPNMLPEKRVLDRRFGFISKRIKLFSSACDDFKGKHTKFESSGDDGSESDSKSHCQGSPRSNSDVQHRVSSCPYPSTTEEIKRLGLQGEADAKTPFRKTRDDKSKKLIGKKRKPIALNLEKRKYFSLDRSTMHDFVATWKEACSEHSVFKVLDMMLNFYAPTNKLKKKGSRRAFSSYPGIGLLNVAIASIRCGTLESIYDVFDHVEHEFDCQTPSAEQIELDILGKEDDPSTKITCTDKLVSRVTEDDILKKIICHFEADYFRAKGDLSLKKEITILRRFHNCEVWLEKEFSVDAFSSLGYGHLVDFLERNLDLMPAEVRCHLDKDSSTGLVVINRKQLETFFSQAQENVVSPGVVTQHYISMLLEKQFPTLCFDFKCDKADFQNLIKEQERCGTSKRVYYATTLLGNFFTEKSNTCKAMKIKTEVDEDAACDDHISAKDAFECLLQVPMLSDLRSWTHWDIVFAPKFGSLLTWLSKEVWNDKISCIAVSDGRLIRIEHSATVDEFLEASIHCSPTRTALKLLSLLALYGGTNNIPVALLKCYSHRAMDAVIKGCIDRQDFSPASHLSLENSLHCQVVQKSDTVRLTCNKGIHIAARFILDCLEHMPSEFHSFTTDILMSGLRYSTKEAPLIMLHECNRTEQRTMLHGIGLSLGIVEWIEDYNLFMSESSLNSSASFQDSSKNLNSILPVFEEDTKDASAISIIEKLSANQHNIISGVDITYPEPQANECPVEDSVDRPISDNNTIESECKMIQNAAALIIESIRREEFGLDPSSSCSDSTLLKKQHARLGRALYCLSHELYSQDSHLLLEMVQNADDNTYPEAAEPTLVFILRTDAIVILNNECGFSAENIKALCDIGNSTKRGSTAGYIGHKGIGFKSVFRVTDAPEIHSNGFHVKFDLSEGPIGFVLPTAIPPCDITLFESQLSSDIDRNDIPSWKTCIVLPFRKQLKERSGMNSIISMFSDLHPSLLLFLHRLKCIMFKNTLDGSLFLMKKEALGDGMVKVSYGKEKMNWLVVRQKLRATVLRPEVQMTEIALAFTLEESDTGEYVPYLNQQPAFAFLPLRTYGLKFIIQGDFVLPSSREEIDGNSAWNQWLLSEFPILFVNSEACFTDLPCFRACPGKAVSAFMSFVPNIGEVHGFFSYLPQMIVSKLRTSRCLLLEGQEMEWVLPCKVLRGWDDKARELLSDCLLQKHLGLGLLDRNIILSDPLAKTLGVRNYGPKVLTDILSSICCERHEIKELGFGWLSDWLIALNGTLSHNSSEYLTLNAGTENDVISDLRRIPFIPLADGSYGSTSEGPIWLPGEMFGIEFDNTCDHCFPRLYAKLRTVDSSFLSSYHDNREEGSRTNDIFRLLQKIGVQQLSAHEVIVSHILPVVSAAECSKEDNDLLVEYLSYVMLHFQNACSLCQIQKRRIVSDLRKSNIILTNHGYKCPDIEPLHFSQEFGNPLEIDKLIDPMDEEWNVVDDIYLKHYSTRPSTSLLIKWRDFFHELGVSDFVQVVRVDKQLKDVSSESEIIAWESPELVRLLSTFSTKKEREKCMYLLEALDKTWDDHSLEAENHSRTSSLDEKPPNRPSFLKCLHDFRWIGSTVDEELHSPKDLFYDCEQVRSILGSFAPYAVPQVKNKKLLHELGFKTQVSHEDALAAIKLCRIPGGPCLASPVQMSKFYNFIWEAVTRAKLSIADEFRSRPLIFLPSYGCSTWSDSVQSGTFISSSHVYWRDPTGCLDHLEKATSDHQRIWTLFKIYPNLHDFFVDECGVLETPPFEKYIDILLQLSKVMLPAQAAHLVFQVFNKWSDDLDSDLIKDEEIVLLRESLSKVENMVLPTIHDRWVSLHPSYGIVCWSDNSELREQFKHSRNVHFIRFGELSSYDSEIPRGKVGTLLQKLGVLALSELVSREAIFYGTEDSSEKAYLVNWALPYAQRYLFKSYPGRYDALRKLAAERLPLLRTVGVDKLFYRYTMKASDHASRKRYECSSLLQDNVMYVTRASDSHSVFLELSRIFFSATGELQFANFLHMISAMAESGSSEEQIELFVVNSQKVPALPVGEPIWSLSQVSSSSRSLPAFTSCFFSSPVNSSVQLSTPPLWRSGTAAASSNWPPTDWKTAPDFSGVRHFAANPRPLPVPYESNRPLEEDVSSFVEVDGDWMVTEQVSDSRKQHASDTNCPAGPAEPVDPEKAVDSDEISLSFSGLGGDSQSRRTGLLGEAIAFKYLKEKYASSSVKWVNEEGETGLPYDLIMEEQGRREFVEVKATRSATKDWFPITTREWQFAADKGESYSIAHVTFPGPKAAKVTLLKNPLRLCQQNVLNLALLMRKQ